jgi:hypothetical protein
MPWGKRVATGAFVMGLVGSFAGPALGQSDEDRAGARAAATEGVRAIEEGRYTDAIDLFTRAESLVHAPPHLLYIARAHVKLGKLVKAHEVYLKITRETWPASAPRAFLQAQSEAVRELAELDARLPNVKVVVEGGANLNVLVSMDDATVPKPLVGVIHPVDPGGHVFLARAKGWASDKVSVNIAERSSETVTLVLKSAPGEPGPPEETPETGGTTGDRHDQGTGGGNGTLRVLSLTSLGLGAAFAVAGTVFLLKNHSARGDADALCPDGRCPSSARSQIESLDSDADSAATAAWITYGVGGAALAAGAVLFVMSSGSSKRDERAARIHPLVGPGSVGLAGSF